ERYEPAGSEAIVCRPRVATQLGTGSICVAILRCSVVRMLGVAPATPALLASLAPRLARNLTQSRSEQTDPIPAAPSRYPRARTVASAPPSRCAQASDGATG